MVLCPYVLRRKKAMTYSNNSNGRHRSGGILALLTSSLLLAAGAALARPDCDDWNTRDFFDQATAADVARCISQGADPKARAEDGWTPLHVAENPEVVKVLLDAGADLEARTDLGATPLHTAASDGSPEVVKALLDAGADLEARDQFGKTPVELVPRNSPLWGTDVYWRLNEGRYR
ncbi:MAG: hypothetical protein F4025_07410 [Synechococcus sp. SB0669_bin_7]|nr:hypothetical protein [Synechococcus sp. SB0675_bin_7]MYK86210.1 hypothetical protein [Synechococcus sp. SB0669_bin_7]